MKKVRAEARQAIQLKNSLHSQNKEIKKMESNFEVTSSQIEQIQEVMEYKLARVNAEIEETKNEQAKFFEIQAKRNENYMDLSTQFTKFMKEMLDQINRFKTGVNN